jgi:hypothetical protein
MCAECGQRMRVRVESVCSGLPPVSIGRLILARGRMTMGIEEGRYVGGLAIFADYRSGDVTKDRMSAYRRVITMTGDVKVAPKIGLPIGFSGVEIGCSFLSIFNKACYHLSS